MEPIYILVTFRPGSVGLYIQVAVIEKNLHKVISRVLAVMTAIIR